MTHQSYLFVLTCFMGTSVFACRIVYPDLCAGNGKENKATEYNDYNEGGACDCQKVIFCSVINLSDECNSATIFYSSNDNPASTQLECYLTPLDSQVNTPVYKIVNKTKNKFEVNIFTEFNLGRYRIACNILEIAEATSVNNNTNINTQWGIVSVSPVEVSVNPELKLELTIDKESQLNLTQIWCFIKTPDSNIQILSAIWVSNSRVDCVGFNPGISGPFQISLGTSITSNTFEKAVTVMVTSKRPVVQEVKYSYDFETIFVNFDENIELRSNCNKLFPEGSEYFGVGFDCHTRGNVLVVKMGQNFKIIDSVKISFEGKVCRAGSDMCFLATSVNLLISKPKVSGPNFSFHIYATCTGDTTQKYMSVNVIPSKGFNLPLQNPTTLAKSSGKAQRRNLIMWRMMRHFQSMLSSRHIVMQLNTTDIQSLFENLPSVDNVLDVDDNLSSTASVSVFLQSSPGSSSILAEASITFCKGLVKLFRYKWVVNGRDVSEDGKLLILRGLSPGKYVIKCMVFDCNSTEILGEGWATTEIFTTDEKILIVPTEITAGTSDEVFLRALTWHDNSVSWTCRTSEDEDCFTIDRKLISDAISCNSPNISIPGGTLPVGMYIWTVESGKGASVARVIIKDGSVASVGVEISSVFIKPSEEVVVLGSVGRIQKSCRVWWSSVRQRGFDYFDLNTIGVNNSILEEFPNKKVPLLFPRNWKPAATDSLFLFQLQVFCPCSVNNQKGSFDYLKLPLVVSNPPRVSPLSIQPLKGETMITIFSISGGVADASVDDYPLTYEWSYTNPCNVEIPIHRGTFPRDLTTFLPPGDLTLNLKVCNGRKTCTTASTPVVNVTQSSQFPADNFHNAQIEIRRLMRSGDILEGFGLATIVLKSLALLAEGEIREEIYSTVEETIKTRIEELTIRTQTDPNSCLDFFERAITVVKYLRKGSDIINRLLEFRDVVLKNFSSSNKVN